MMVTQVIGVPPGVAWRRFTDVARRAGWLPEVDDVVVLSSTDDETQWRETRHARSARHGVRVTEELRLTVVEPGRRCVVALARDGGTTQREYLFMSIEVGAHRGGTAVTVTDDGPALAGRLLDLVAGGFAARTVEGAVRDELDALAGACITRVMVAA